MFLVLMDILNIVVAQSQGSLYCQNFHRQDYHGNSICYLFDLHLNRARALLLTAQPTAPRPPRMCASGYISRRGRALGLIRSLTELESRAHALCVSLLSSVLKILSINKELNFVNCDYVVSLFPPSQKPQFQEFEKETLAPEQGLLPALDPQIGRFSVE